MNAKENTKKADETAVEGTVVEDTTELTFKDKMIRVATIAGAVAIAAGVTMIIVNKNKNKEVKTKDLDAELAELLELEKAQEKTNK
jgi:adenylate kinase